MSRRDDERQAWLELVDQRDREREAEDKQQRLETERVSTVYQRIWCPACGAPEGEPCRKLRTRPNGTVAIVRAETLLEIPHEARIKADPGPTTEETGDGPEDEYAAG